jgi:hypothetical protein
VTEYSDSEEDDLLGDAPIRVKRGKGRPKVSRKAKDITAKVLEEPIEDQEELIEELPEQPPAEHLNFLRFKSQFRLKTSWERIFEKYGREFDSDEVDLVTGQVVVDRGYIRNAPIISMGCTITEIDSDEEMVVAKELYEQATRHVSLDEETNAHVDTNALELYQHTQEQDYQHVQEQDCTKEQYGQLLPAKRSRDYGYEPYQYHQPYTVIERIWDIPFEPQPQEPMWPFNFQNEFLDYSPKRIKRVYMPVVRVVPQIVRYLTPRVVPMFRQIEPIYQSTSSESSEESDVDELTK